MVMQIVDRMQTQICVYWAPTTTDNFGKKRFDDPVELTCRWDYRTDLMVDKVGRQFVSKSRVYLPSDVEVEGVLWLSERIRATYTPGEALADLVSATKPFENPKAFEIKRFDSINNIKADTTVRTAFL